MTDVELRDELMTLLVAGHETTATALAWAFDLLVHHPEAMARLHAEIEQGEGEDYLDAVIKETLRLRPVVPGVVRKLTRPMELNGYRASGGHPPRAEHLPHPPAPDVYPEPDRFQPERFLEPSRRHLHLDPLRRRDQAVPRRQLRPLRAEGRDPGDARTRSPRRGRTGPEPIRRPSDHVRARARRPRGRRGDRAAPTSAGRARRRRLSASVASLPRRGRSRRTRAGARTPLR